MVRILCDLIRWYQQGISAQRPFRVCRFTPSCSQYMLEVQQIFIGDRLIGEVVTDNERFKAMLISDQSEFYVRSQEEGLEIVLQQYHLHQH